MLVKNTGKHMDEVVKVTSVTLAIFNSSANNNFQRNIIGALHSDVIFQSDCSRVNVIVYACPVLLRYRLSLSLIFQINKQLFKRLLS